MVGKQVLVSVLKKIPIKEYIVRNKTGFDAVFRTIATVMETKDMMVDPNWMPRIRTRSLQQLMVKKVVKAMWQEWVANMKLVKRSGSIRA